MMSSTAKELIDYHNFYMKIHDYIYQEIEVKETLAKILECDAFTFLVLEKLEPFIADLFLGRHGLDYLLDKEPKQLIDAIISRIKCIPTKEEVEEYLVTNFDKLKKLLGDL